MGCAVAVLAVTGCAPNPVTVELRFPREDNFLFSDFGRLVLYPVDGMDELGACPALLESANAGTFDDPTLDSDWEPVCAFRDGYVFPSVPEGPHAYVMLTRNEANAIMLTGCRVAEAYDGAPAVRISMYPTDEYEGAVAGRTLTCGTAEAKCTSGCR